MACHAYSPTFAFWRDALRTAVCLAVIAVPGQAQPQRGVREASPAAASGQVGVEAEARAVLAELVAANTTASGGATTPVATLLAARFRAAGFPAADVMVIGPNARNRNLVVRWKGRADGKPIVLNAHLDVVEAPRLDWSTDPFRLTERDGYLYGRGVLDDKGPAAAIVAAMLAAKRAGVVPSRDIVLALTAGEESGIDNGVQWLLEHRRALVDALYVLNLDSGAADMVDGRPQAFAVQAAEKIYLDLEFIARGPGGHSSIPSGPTPIDALARALQRVGEHRFPIRIDPVFRMFLERRAPIRGGEVGEAMAALAREPNDLRAQNILLGDPTLAALMRTTCIATMLRGGTAPNAIPQEVAATVNCRLLPGDTQESTIGALRAAIRDTTIGVTVLSPADASEPSIPSAELLAMIERVVAAVFPGVSAIPYLEAGATDALWFRNAGIPTFGVSGVFVPQDDLERMHGRDERISVSAFGVMVRYSERLLREIAR